MRMVEDRPDHGWDTLEKLADGPSFASLQLLTGAICAYRQPPMNESNTHAIESEHWLNGRKADGRGIVTGLDTHFLLVISKRDTDLRVLTTTRDFAVTETAGVMCP